MPIVSFSRQLELLAAADPDRPAVTCGATSLTRRELVGRIDDLAHEIQPRNTLGLHRPAIQRIGLDTAQRDLRRPVTL